MRIKLSEFRFELPSSLIALYPTHNRDESRLMVVHKDTGKIEHKTFKDIVDYFSEKDLFVINDSKVFPARLYGNKEKTRAKIEVFLLRELNPETNLWDVLVDPARKIRIGNKLFFGEDELVAEVIDNTTNRGRTIKFILDKDESNSFHEIINNLGETPLPKAIKRKTEPQDKERFQTIYAKNLGSIAAPSAGLHFTPQLMKKLELTGINIANITLHIGLSTFRPVNVEDLTKHKMESENYWVSDLTAKRGNQALNGNQKICAVGTTVMKTLETSISANGQLIESTGWTDKFIFPPYNFKVCDALITNFHLPKSTVLMMASAFAGLDLLREAYRIAIEKKYRFFSYGDAMLII